MKHMKPLIIAAAFSAVGAAANAASATAVTRDTTIQINGSIIGSTCVLTVDTTGTTFTMNPIAKVNLPSKAGPVVNVPAQPFKITADSTCLSPGKTLKLMAHANAAAINNDGVLTQQLPAGASNAAKNIGIQLQDATGKKIVLTAADAPIGTMDAKGALTLKAAYVTLAEDTSVTPGILNTQFMVSAEYQ